MRLGKIEVKRRVWVALGAAGVVVAVWWHSLAGLTPARPVALTQPKPPFVRVAAVGAGTGGHVLREQAELLDPTPLFFPTEWNFDQRPLPEGMLKQPGQVFGSFPPNLDFGEKGIKAYGAESVVVQDRLVDVVAQSNEAPFAGMGQIDIRLQALPERSGFLEIRDFGTGKNIIGQSLTGITVPRSDYAPVEFLVVVSSAGLVGEPILMTGSGWEEVDAFFRTFLVKTFRLGERLSPGRYRVLVGP